MEVALVKDDPNYEARVVTGRHHRFLLWAVVDEVAITRVGGGPDSICPPTSGLPDR